MKSRAGHRSGLALAMIAFVVAVAAGGVASAPRSAPPSVRVEPIATFDHYVLLEPGAWSPSGTRLALVEAPPGEPPSRVAVFDPTQPAVPPRDVYDARQWIRSCGWSPDGAWLLVLFGSPSADDRRWLVAVPTDGASPETLLVTGGIWPAAWGSDGRIHCRVEWRWRALEPPARWKPAATFVPRRVRSAEPGPGSGLKLRDQTPGSGAQALMLGTYFTSTGDVRVLDALPDGSRALVSVVGKMSKGAVRVVDGSGRSLLDLRRAGIRFQPTAISGDGGLIAGLNGKWEGEGGWTETWLEAADAGGRWSTRVTGGEDGQEPQLSREGSYIAFLATKGTTVARLVVEPR